MKIFKMCCKIDLHYFNDIVCYKNKYYICKECYDGSEYYDIYTESEIICLKYKTFNNFFYTDEEIRKIKLNKLYETNL